MGSDSGLCHVVIFGLEKRNFTFVREDGDGDYFVLGFRVYGIFLGGLGFTDLFFGSRVYGFVFRF